MNCGHLASRIRIRRVVSVAALLGAFLTMVQSAAAQHLSSSASVRIAAVVRGSVTVNVRSVPLSMNFDPADPASNHAAFPLSISWNLNPAEVHGFEVIGYFGNPDAALKNGEHGIAVPSSHVLGRIDSGPFRPFNETSQVGPTGGSLMLLQQSVVEADSRGTRASLLEMRLDQENLPELQEGIYDGMLYIEVRHY